MRIHLAANHVFLVTLFLTLLIATGGCGGKGNRALMDASSSVAQQSNEVGTTLEDNIPGWESGKAVALDQAIAAIEGYALPNEINVSLQDELKAELIRVLSARGDSKLVSTPPEGEPNRIMDLRLTSEAGGELTLAWSYISLGDYDQNGEVNISDLTPLGVNFGVTGTFAYSTALSVVDGDGNGEINIADVTPIGQHLRNSIVHYAVYASADMADYPATADAPNGEGATLLGTVAFTSATGTPAVDRLGFTFAVAAPADGDYYWVRPSDGTSEGAPSGMISTMGRGDWWMYSREPQLNARSLYRGPWANDLLWTYTTGDEVNSSPAIRADGTVYIGSDDDSLHAINPDGAPDWTFPTGGDVYSSPAIATDGTIYVGSCDDNVYAINPDGSQRWVVTTGEDVFSSPSIGADGTIYVGSNDNNLYAISPAGEVDWTFPTGDAIHSCPAIGPHGTVVFGSFDGVVYAVNPDGTERWQFPTGDAVRGSAAIGPDGTAYIGSTNANLYAINFAGAELWHYPVSNTIFGSPAIGVDGAIYTLVSDSLYALNPDGTRRWRLVLPGYKASSPAIGADGNVYVGSGDSFYAVHASGAQHWLYEAAGTFYGSPAIRSDGTVIVGCADGNVYAFGGGTGTAAAVIDVMPRDGVEGTQVTIIPVLSGTPPFTFSWDFGTGAAPGTSAEQAPTVTLGAVGAYNASVTVENEYGAPVTFPFPLMVTPSSYTDGWVHSWGGELWEYTRDVAVDSEGNVYAVGSTDSYGAGREDVLLLKYDTTGALLFAETWGGAGDDWATSILIDGADNLFVVGCTESFEDDNGDLLLLRYDTAGTLSWEKTWDSGEAEIARGVDLDTSGNLLIVGEVANQTTWITVGALVRYSATGNFEWARSWSGGDYDYFSSIAIDDTDNVYVAGRCRSFGEGESDLLLLRYSSAGALDWARIYGTEASDRDGVVALDADNNVYLAGSYSYVLRYTPAGVMDWARAWHETGAFRPRDICVIGAEIYLAGSIRDADGNWDPAVMQGSLTGDAAWGQRFVTVYDDDLFFGIAPTSAGQLCLGGLGWSDRGWWEGFAVGTVADPGVENIPASTVADLAGTGNDVTGTAQIIPSVEAVGAGEDDALVICWDFSGTE